MSALGEELAQRVIEAKLRACVARRVGGDRVRTALAAALGEITHGREV
jgi:hypothetical protein